MRFQLACTALAVVVGVSIVSCNDTPTIPRSTPMSPHAASYDETAASKVVISQVYGGGGNAGATYKNDFIELFNTGTTAISLEGWSVQYASAAGTSWTNKTNLTGSIAPGSYYLVQETAGTGGTTALPTPNATGTIALSATAGKVALVSSTTALTGACPSDATIVDLVGFGTGTSGASCFEGSAAAPTLSNTTAALRKDNGNQDTNDNAADFASGAPNPRAGTSGGGTTVGPFDHVAISGGTSVSLNATITLTAILQDASSQTITDSVATYAWQSSDETTAQVLSTSANSATIKGLKVGGPVTMTATSTSNGVTKSATMQLTVAQPVLGHISIGSGTSPLVVGYQTQLFVNSGSTDQSGNPVTSATVTWSTADANILTVDARGVVTAVANGSTTLSATAADGSVGSFTLATEVPLYSSTARAGHNTEFGVPADNDPSNDVIVARKQYTISYNPQRGGPNWVSWDLSATHLGSRDRCNCYSADTALARLGVGQFMYNTADYTGSGYDRGHMEPSADQTTTDGENAATFFLTNFLPQTHGLNAGPWEALEYALRDSLTKGGREAYVIAGGIFTNGVGLGSLKSEGKIFVPDSTWKIVVLMPANTGLANVTSATDVDVIAVNMPNVDSPGTNDWTAFKTTVDKLQHSTGYNFLSALPEAIQCRVEVRDCGPAAHISGAGLSGGTEGQTLTFDAATSSGGTLSYLWTIDGTAAGIQPTLSHTFADNGTFAIRLIVSNQTGGADTATAAVTVTNVPPMVSTFAGASLSKGGTFTSSGSFTDPGTDSWTATVDYADGSGAHPLALVGKTFSLSHGYTAPGSYAVKVTVTETDTEAGSGSQTATVTVTNVAPAVKNVGGATLLRGELYLQAGGFTDSDADKWTATVDYGDGGGTQSLKLLGKNFALLHQYPVAGTFTVTVSVSDGYDTRNGTATVVVKSAAQALDELGSSVAALGGNGGRLNQGQVNSLQAKLDAAKAKLAADNKQAASKELAAFVEELNATMKSGKVPLGTGLPIGVYAGRVILSINVS